MDKIHNMTNNKLSEGARLLGFGKHRFRSMRWVHEFRPRYYKRFKNWPRYNLHLKNRAAWAVRAKLFIDWVEKHDSSAHGVASARRKRGPPVFFHEERFVPGSGAVNRFSFDPTDMGFNGGAGVVPFSSSGSYRMNDFVVSDDDQSVSASETDDETLWSSSDDESECDESDFEVEPEVGMVIKEKWKMSDGSFDWFDGIIVSQCSRYFKVKWRGGGKCTIYNRRSWAEKVETGSLKIID